MIKFILLALLAFPVFSATQGMTVAQWDLDYFLTTSNPLPTTCTTTVNNTSTACGENFAWTQDKYISGYLSMAKLTGDVKYLDKAKTIIDFMLTKQSVGGGWGSELGASTYFLNSAVVARTISLYAVTVWDDSRFWAYRAGATAYLTTIETIIRLFDYQWVDPSGFSGVAFYRYSTCPPNPQNLCGNTSLLMYNQGAAMGHAMLLVKRAYELRGLTPPADFTDKASKIATYFKQFVNNANWYSQWDYDGIRPDNQPNNKIEDTSHGSLDVAFLYEAYQQSFLADDDMDRIAETLATKLIQHNDVAANIDGTGTYAAGSADRAVIGIGWLNYVEFTDYNCLAQITRIFNERLQNKPNNPVAANGWANLLLMSK